MRIIENKGLSLDDVLLIPKYNAIDSRLNTDVSTNLTTNTRIKIPLMSTNMSTITGLEMAKVMNEVGGVGAVHRFMSIADQVGVVNSLRWDNVNPIVASIGVGSEEFKRANSLINAGAHILLIDVAHGYSRSVFKQLKDLQNLGGATQYIVGNISCGESAEAFMTAGVDGLRVGIGGGSRCTTRKVTGHGVPNLTALASVAIARDEYLSKTDRYVPIIIDGGIKSSGDIVKALAFGADVACIGNLFAGTHETPGEFIEQSTQQFKKFYGMSSKEAQDIYKGGMKEGIAAEGFSELVPYKGSVRPILSELVGGIRSGLTYSGASSISDLRDKAEAVILSSGARQESKL